MDFVDVDTSKDVKLFLDPLLLSDGFRNIVNDFVNTVYKMYTLGNKAGHFNCFHTLKNVMLSTLDILRVTPKGQVFQ